jgi:DNA-binding CsgD family transcriptional regulator
VSRRIVGYEGEGKHRRPIYADEGPASAAASSPMAMHTRLVLPGREIGAPTGGAGPVERRQITEAERDARQDGRPALNSPEHLQQSRLNGAARTSAIHAARRASQAPEEEPMAVTQDIHVVIEARTPFVRLAEAAQGAGTARHAREMAHEAWRIAAAELEAAWASVNEILTTPQAELDAMGESIEAWAREIVPGGHVDHGATTTPLESEPAPLAPPPTIVSTPTPHQVRQAASRMPAGLTRRQTQVLEGLRAGKSRADIGRELGVTYQSVDGILEAMAKKGLLPAEFIPALPARFAKYATVDA